mgnify:CR=1 FL=1
MKGISNWQFTPYRRPIDDARPYICRIEPRCGAFVFDWLDGVGQRCDVYFRKADGEFERRPAAAHRVTVDGLENNSDYEFFLRRDDGTESAHRLVHVCDAPENAAVIDYLHPLDDIYEYSGHALAAPTLVKLPSGKLIAGTSVCCDRTRWPSDPCLDVLFESTDGGNSWSYLCDIRPAFNSKLFWHRGKLYLLTLSTDYCDLIIGCSEDEGRTWSRPVTLLRGEGVRRYGWHRGSYPIVEKDGRLYTAIEYGHVEEITEPTPEELDNSRGADADEPADFEFRTLFNACSPGKKLVCNLAHYSGVLSVPADADLMQPESWTVSRLYYPEDDPRQCIEGNIVELPDGRLYNLIRTMRAGKSLLLRLDENDPAEGMPQKARLVEDFPLSAVSKFVVHRDPVTGAYVAFGNLHDPKRPSLGRRVLAMAVSEDFERWRVAHIVADGSAVGNAFTYPEWLIDGEDVLLVSRTAWNGAVNQHDTNMITFHRISNFRRYL